MNKRHEQTKTRNVADNNVEQTDNKAKAPAVEVLRIPPPKVEVVSFRLLGGEKNGGSALGICRFSAKAQEAMEAAQRAGGTTRTKRNRPPKDFEQLFKEAAYISPEGWFGLHAAALRNAMISACRVVDFKMTHMKISGLRVLEDGRDRFDGTPLIRIWGGAPECWTAPVRNANGSFDLRARPRWTEWELRPRIQYDADMFTIQDISNLVARVGFQVGVGEGRPDSKNSAGLGMGLFTIQSEEAKKAA